MSGRIYTIYPTTPPTGVAAARDLISFQVGALKVARVLIAKVKNAKSEEAQQIACRLAIVAAFGTGGVTTGISVKKHDQGSPTHGFQALRINDTTPATVAANDEIWKDADDIRAGLLYHPTPEEYQWLAPSTRVVLSLLEGPAAAGGAELISSITVEEIC